MPARAAAACTGPGWADRGVARSLIANYANYGNRGIITGVAGGAVTGQTRAAGVVGRDRQLAALLAALDAVGDGPVGCTVHGPAGIGKTALWRAALTDAAERGYRVLSCRPAESEAGLSFAGLRDLVDDGPDSLLATLPDRQREALEIALLRRASDGAPPGPRAVPVALLSVVRALTDAAPVVLAVDDAQWLDSPTAQAIEYVAGHLTREPVCLLVTARGDGEPPFGLAQTLGAGRLTRIALTGLNADALHTLVSTRSPATLSRPLLRRIEHYSGGNPFFALELVRAVEQSEERPGPDEPLTLPDDVRDVVAARIQQLPQSARQAVEVVALLAAPTVDLVVAVLGERDGLRIAEEDGVIEVDRGQIRLAHPLFGSAARPSAARRRRLHARLAELVTDVEQRAWHLALSSELRDAQVADALDAAAAKAQERGAPTSAAQLWELASRRTPEIDSTLGATRMTAAGAALFRAGDTAQARGLLETALQALPAGPDRARALLELSDVAFHEGGSQSAAALCDQAFTEAEGARLLQVLAGVRRTWYGTQDLAAERRAIEATLRLLTDDDVVTDPELVACAWLMAVETRFYDGQGIDWDLFERARGLLRPDSRTWAGDWGRMTWRTLAKIFQRDLREVRDAYATEFDVARDLGDESAMGTLLTHLADVDCWLGDWEQARAESRQAMEILEQPGSTRMRAYALHTDALLLAHTGDLDNARATADEGLALATGHDDAWVATMHLAVLGFVAICRDDVAEADRHLTRAGELLDGIGLAEGGRHRFHGDQVEAAVAVGDLDRAGVLVERLVHRAEIAPYPWLVAITARSRGILAMAHGDLDTSAAAFTEAMAAHDRLSIPFERARTQLWHGRLLRRCKERLAAKVVLSQAARAFTELGAALWAERAIAELDRLGLRRGVTGELTPTEQRIAGLVASGLTNAEVAAAAFVTVNTVEANLHRIYRKLGITSRRELAVHRSDPSGSLHPVEGASDSDLPARELGVASGGVDGRQPLGRPMPIASQGAEVRPDPDREPGGVGRTE